MFCIRWTSRTICSLYDLLLIVLVSECSHTSFPRGVRASARGPPEGDSHSFEYGADWGDTGIPWIQVGEGPEAYPIPSSSDTRAKNKLERVFINLLGTKSVAPLVGKGHVRLKGKC